ncbi:MAG: Fe-S cluster assembly sulfur transfer protein SufU [Mycoplasmatales bacterium]
MDNNFKREVLLHHNKTPHNRVDSTFDDKSYIKKSGINPSCGDQLTMYIKFDGEEISDIKHDGDGCTMCCASASISTDEVKGKTKNEAINKIENFDKYIKGQECEVDLFEDAIIFEDAKDFPNRYKCFNLAWSTIEEVVRESNE